LWLPFGALGVLHAQPLDAKVATKAAFGNEKQIKRNNIKLHHKL
jgi:hypothetical protein